MPEFPKQLPALRRGIANSCEECARWQRQARKHNLSTHTLEWAALLPACHRATLGCVDGDAIQAARYTKEAIAARWSGQLGAPNESI